MRKFNSQEERYGHMAHCNATNLIDYNQLRNNFLMREEEIVVGHEIENDIEAFIPNDEPIAMDDVDVDEVNKTYIRFQNFIESVLVLGSDQMSKVKMQSGVWKHGNRNVYIELMLFSSSRSFLSEDDNTKLLELVKSITLTNGHEIPLPSR
jgi:hypothetical protein